jgi:hypothetical protein
VKKSNLAASLNKDQSPRFESLTIVFGDKFTGLEPSYIPSRSCLKKLADMFTSLKLKQCVVPFEKVAVGPTYREEGKRKTQNRVLGLPCSS